MRTPSQITGTGNITAYGLVSDIALAFNPSTTLTQTIPMGSSTLTLDMTYANPGVLGAGLCGHRLAVISDGAAVTSSGGFLGYKPDFKRHGHRQRQRLEVDRSTPAGHMYVGYYGAGTLNCQQRRLPRHRVRRHPDTSAHPTAGCSGTATFDGLGTTGYVYGSTIGGNPPPPRGR